jgi:hypothetical protein
MEDLLAEAADHFAAVLSVLQGYNARPTYQSELEVYNGISLPRPTKALVTKKLEKYGAPYELAQEMARVHRSRAAELAQAYEDIFKNTRLQLINAGCDQERLESNLRKLHEKLKTSYRESLKTWMEDMRTKLLEYSPPTGSSTSSRQTQFNVVRHEIATFEMHFYRTYLLLGFCSAARTILCNEK